MSDDNEAEQFVRTVAAFTKNGEVPDGGEEPFEMTAEDNYDTINNLIDKARNIMLRARTMSEIGQEPGFFARGTIYGEVEKLKVQFKVLERKITELQGGEGLRKSEAALLLSSMQAMRLTLDIVDLALKALNQTDGVRH